MEGPAVGPLGNDPGKRLRAISRARQANTPNSEISTKAVAIAAPSAIQYWSTL